MKNAVGLSLATERFNLNLGEGVEVGRDFIFQWLFIDNATPETCAALPVDATCANVPGCFFAVGPATMLPDRWTVTGQNAAGVCSTVRPMASGLCIQRSVMSEIITAMVWSTTRRNV